MITTCTTCGKCYEAGSEEQANEQVRQCPECWTRRKSTPMAANSRLAKILAGCVKCARHVPATRQQAASTNELVTEIHAAEDAVDPHAAPLTMHTSSGFQPDPVPQGVMESIAAMGSEQDLRNAAASVDPHAVPLVALGPDSTDRTAAARAMADSSERPFQGSADHHAVLDLMEAMGGSFVSALAVAWRKADEFDHARLYKAFGHYYREYREHLYAERQRRGGAV